MTKDEIVQLAHDADCGHVNIFGDRAAAIERLSKFAQLVAAKERDACAMLATDEDCIVEGGGYYDQLGDARATAENIADCIRARGNK